MINPVVIGSDRELTMVLYNSLFILMPQNVLPPFSWIPTIEYQTLYNN